MTYETTKYKVLSSLIWKLLERGGSQGIQFIVTIVLARLLLPTEYGLIVLVTIFINIAGVVVQGGFNTALIQKKDAGDIDFSSVFYLNLFIASLLYLFLFFTSPLIAAFFYEPELKGVLRVLSISLFITAFNSIQLSVISRKFLFKNLFFSSLGAMILSGIIGVTMAYAGYGVWALVAHQITNQLIVTVILFFTVKWRPKLIFSMNSIQTLFTFGWKLLVSGLIDTLYINLRSILIGKMFSPAILGFYNRGEQFPNLIINNINGSIQSVMLPTLALYQDNKLRVRELVRRSIVTSSFIVFPLMVGMAVIAKPMIMILLTEKWLPLVPFLQIFCASYALWPIHTANLQVINALGRSDIYLKIEIIKKLIGLLILIISIPFGVYAMAYGVLVTGIISTFINSYPNIKLINYSFIEQWKDIFPSLLLSILMGIVIFFIPFIGLSTSLTLFSQVSIGVIIYIGLAIILKLECFNYLLSILKDTYKKKQYV